MNQVMTTVNMHLAELSETYNSSLLEELWLSIEGVVHLRDCEVYSYVPDMEEDPFSEGVNLWTFNYFFFNRSLKRILYFTCIATSKFSGTSQPVPQLGDSDVEDMDEDREEDAPFAGDWEEEV